MCPTSVAVVVFSWPMIDYVFKLVTNKLSYFGCYIEILLKCRKTVLKPNTYFLGLILAIKGD